MRNIFFVCLVAIGFSACEKDAGEGGTSVIEGQVYEIYTSEIVVDELDSLGISDTTYISIDTLYYKPDAGKDVFIIYGDDKGEVYDDKFETDYNGRYRFEYLRKGNYTIYTYTDSIQSMPVPPIPVDLLLKYEYPIFKHVKITSNNSTNKVDDFVIEKN